MNEVLIFEGLSHRYRRAVLRYLHEHAETPTLDEVATQIAVWEHEETRDTVVADRCQRIATQLHHNHLPQLADVGVIEYDAHAQQVTATNADAELAQYLDLWD